MNLDGFFFTALIKELETELTGSRVEEVYTDSDNKLYLQLRAPGRTQKLMISVISPPFTFFLAETVGSKNRTGFTQVLRNALAGKFLTKITNSAFDRWASFYFADTPDASPAYTLELELMGRQNDLTLTDNTKIIATSRIGDSEQRTLQPGHRFTPPPTSNKLKPQDLSADYLEQLLAQRPAEKIAQSLVRLVFGVSVVLATEICHRAKIDPRQPANIDDIPHLIQVINVLTMNCLENNVRPVAYFNGNELHSIYWTELTHLHELREERLASLSQALALQFSAWRNQQLIKDKQNIAKHIHARLKRTEKKLGKQLKELETAKNHQQFREIGDTLLAGLYQIGKGQSTVELINPHNAKSMEIRLNPELSASENAQSYYRKARKYKDAAKIVQQQINKSRQLINYLESLHYSLEQCKNSAELEEIITEMREQGLFKKRQKKSAKGEAKLRSEFIRQQTPLGENVLIGKNNRQNDLLTLHVANKNHIWLHVRDYPGSHVILETPDPDQNSLEYAASLAAWHSKARGAAKVEVVYTSVRNVKKIPGGKPGMVNYYNYRSLVIDPRAHMQTTPATAGGTPREDRQ
ncbi:MAG: fibronectin-binding domain-containing protein [Firmicutes bacterium]|nr:fibronectin-binding domain-containing protein [Bacillota bacterium]